MNELSYKNNSTNNTNWAQETASVFKILSDPTRCKILRLLVQKKGEMCVGEIADAIKATHSAASHQLTSLETRGVLKSFREGQTICYEVSDSRLSRNIVSILEIFFAEI